MSFGAGNAARSLALFFASLAAASGSSNPWKPLVFSFLRGLFGFGRERLRSGTFIVAF